MKTVFLSTYPPKRCGIATYTYDLSHTLKISHRANPSVISFRENRQSFSEKQESIKFTHNEIDIPVYRSLIRDEKESYKAAARQVNNSNVDLVHIQHEFGIFGGRYGAYIVEFAERLEKPLITTFHSVQSEPEEERKKVVKMLAKRCDKIIVHSEIGREFLTSIYGLQERKIEVIPHGAPKVDIGRISKSLKKKLNLSGFPLLTNFGFLAPTKGLEYAIEALAKIVERYPRAHLLIVGQTHPNEIRRSGESYRRGLKGLAEDLGIDGNLSFVNRFVSQSQLTEYLLASDIYLIPYPNQNQISSGTLSYALGCGRAIISTIFDHALETIGGGSKSTLSIGVVEKGVPGKRLLLGERGILVPFRDPEAISEAVILLIERPRLKEMLERNALDYVSRNCSWSKVASRHLVLYKRTIVEMSHLLQYHVS